MASPISRQDDRFCFRVKATLLLFARSDSVRARLRAAALGAGSLTSAAKADCLDGSQIPSTHGRMAEEAEQSGRRQPAGADPERPLLLAVDDDIEALRRPTRAGN